MVRKYICDNCGKTFDSLYGGEYGDTRNLVQIAWAGVGFDSEKYYYSPIVEVCRECKEKIVARIKEGV